MKFATLSAAALLAVSCGAFAQTVTPTYDITGVWQSAGGGTSQIFQSASKATVVFVGPDFAQKVEFRYTSPTVLQGMQMRVTRATGCTTNAWLTATMQSNDFVTISGVALDSNCDLVKGQIFTDTITRLQ